jgi:hypothetical protein
MLNALRNHPVRSTFFALVTAYLGVGVGMEVRTQRSPRKRHIAV